ncbi:membrane lipoprotein lipid attachment site-containing protein [Neisseria sp. RH3002v2f]|uniref:membrane lipoprotein lipid attachment site-containing protein n=1 Tax=Neisseria sp. RH3002v2f TaxID=1871108 RepID=UPI001661738C|nr:membrane lipoprotein lipid attachment site-containing protein [Neisseria sp. RH3002v2f]MBD0765066.1 hypothetical protein [Neisseria sp. RH3002v2f]
MKKLILAITSAFILAGCAAMNEPSQQQLAAATFPEPVAPSEFGKVIKEWAVDTLADPDSMNVREIDTEPARKGWVSVCTQIEPTYGICLNRVFYFGHIFNARINAKNQHGGYVGFKNYVFVLRGNKISYGEEADKISSMKFLPN